MISAGYCPSVRLFEAAACGSAIISDYWRGLEEFFTPGEEILVASRPEDVLQMLSNLGEEQSARIGRRARERVLKRHTSAHRALELERRKVKRLMMFQTLTMPGDETADDTGDCEISDRSRLLEAGWPKDGIRRAQDCRRPKQLVGAQSRMRRSDAALVGFRIRERPGHEVYLCERR